MASITQRMDNVQVRNDRIDVAPTLIIGMGGSGKEVLLRLRRLFFTNSRQVGLPIVQYLWIDTDPRRQDILGQDLDTILEHLYFPEPDIIDAQVPPEEITFYFNHQRQFAHIFEWLHPSIKKLGSSMLQMGAGQVRPCGRLAFFHHFSKIRDRIESKLRSITDQGNINKTTAQGYVVDPGRLNVHLIASIAGGTGAGMFLDTAFLVKELRPNAMTTGIFFLPSLFDGIGGTKDFREKIYSNGYASLKELDYFLSPTVGPAGGVQDLFPVFTFKWDGNPHLIPAPPFFNVYCLDSQNSSGKTFSSSSIGEAFQMAAESIFIEYRQSTFGGKKRSIRSNLNDFLLNETRFIETDADGNQLYSQYFLNRYSSFGLSFIKLDIERKRNAAAYFLSKSLASFWMESSEWRGHIKDEVDEALTRDNIIWGPETIKGFILKTDDLEILNDMQKGLIENDFAETVSEIEKEFSAGTLEGMRQIYSDLEEKLNTFQRKVSEKWNAHVARSENLLGLNKKDYVTINKNADEFYKLLETSFTDKFYALLSRPGLREEKKGIKWAEAFLGESIDRLKEIYSEGFGALALPDKKCPFVAQALAEASHVENCRRYQDEAEAIKMQPFGNTAVDHYKERHEAELKKYLDDQKALLLKEVERVKEILLNYYEIKYQNIVCDKVGNVIDNLNKYLSESITFGEGVNAKIEVKGLRGDLNKYALDIRSGLRDIVEVRSGLHRDYGKDLSGVRYYIINQDTNDTWYRSEIQKTLARDAAQNWEDILDQETDGFLGHLLSMVPEGRMQNQKEVKIRDWGFPYLFNVVKGWDGRGNDWKRLCEELDNYCFNRMSTFMADTNADLEFQKSLQGQKSLQSGRPAQEDIVRITDMSDAWIPASSWQEGRGVPMPAIGVPNTGNSPTGTDAQKGSRLYAGISENILFQHENGEIVFYKEVGAFPLFHIGSVKNYKKSYVGMHSDLDDLYKRHIDFNLLNKVRDVLPPSTQTETVELFNIGRSLFEMLLFGCLDVVENELWFCPPRSGRDPLERLPLGGSLSQVVQNLYYGRQTKAGMGERYLNGMKVQLEKQKRKSEAQSRDIYLEVIRLLDYYANVVYPVLSRGGVGIPVNDKNFVRLLVDGLRRNYYDVCCSRYLQKPDANYPGGVHDPQLEELINNEIEKIRLEEISVPFPFQETEAHGEMRILKI